MKTTLLALLFSGVLAAPGLRAQAPGTPAPADTAAPASPAPAAIPAPTEDEKALAKLEQDWGDATMKGDVAFLDRYEAEEYVYTDPGGQLSNKHDSLEAAKAGKVKISSFKIRDLKVRIYGDMAVLTGQTQLKATNDDGNISGDYRWTDVFVRRDGRWQAVASQATAIQSGDTTDFNALPRAPAAVASEGVSLPALIRVAGSVRSALTPEEKTLIQLEYAWARASATGDTAFADRIEAPEYVFTSFNGQKRNKSEDLFFMRSNHITFELRNVRAQVDGETAMVTGQATEMEGDLSAEIRWTDRFVRRDGRWLAISGVSKLTY